MNRDVVVLLCLIGMYCVGVIVGWTIWGAK